MHKNDAAIINRVSSNLESLVERAEIVEEELGELKLESGTGEPRAAWSR